MYEQKIENVVNEGMSYTYKVETLSLCVGSDGKSILTVKRQTPIFTQPTIKIPTHLCELILTNNDGKEDCYTLSIYQVVYLLNRIIGGLMMCRRDTWPEHELICDVCIEDGWNRNIDMHVIYDHRLQGIRINNDVLFVVPNPPAHPNMYESLLSFELTRLANFTSS